MIYNFLLMLLPVTPILAIVAAIGFYIFAKNHMKDDAPKRKSSDSSSDDWEPYNRNSLNNDVTDYLNGPYS